MEKAFASKIDRTNNDTMISDLKPGPQEEVLNPFTELSEPFSGSEIKESEANKVSEIREKLGVATKKENFSEQDHVNMLKEAMEYIARGWVFGIDRLMMTATPEFISSPNFQEAVRTGILTALKENQADNALNIKDMYLEDFKFLEDPNLLEAAKSSYDKYVKAGNEEMADRIRNEFLLQDKRKAV
ncbi:MAG: hypothetical protein P1P90_05100 [Patescibacteria group bacterium]|nr:hypothetical protein [Patescibacteria group bacterium]